MLQHLNIQFSVLLSVKWSLTGTLGARGFFLVRGDRIERRSRVAKRREKNLWHQGITTSLPCRRQFPLIDIRSLLFSHLGKTGLAKIIAHLTNSSPFKDGAY